MNFNFGDYTQEAKEIARKSYEIVSRIVPGDSKEDIIKRRVVIATGNVKLAKLIEFRHNPIEAGIEALRDGAEIICDVQMVKAGIRYSKVKCVLDENPKYERTRVYSGFKKNISTLDRTIVVVGNAPSGALAVYEAVKKGARPRLIVATPVGFVNAANSKYLIRTLDVPSITTRGSIGGSPIAIAITNGIVDFYERSS